MSPRRSRDCITSSHNGCAEIRHYSPTCSNASFSSRFRFIPRSFGGDAVSSRACAEWVGPLAVKSFRAGNAILTDRESMFGLIRAPQYCTLHRFGSINALDANEKKRLGFCPWNDTGCRSKRSTQPGWDGRGLRRSARNPRLLIVGRQTRDPQRCSSPTR